MAKIPCTIDFRGELIFLGTGTSVGVPSIGCGCDVCRSSDPRDKRTRSSVVLGLPEGNLLIDTSPDLRTQLLREGIGLIHAVAYTHAHADHLFGLDDLRIFSFFLDDPVPLYCEPQVERHIRRAYDYAFLDHEPTHTGAAPKLEIRPLSTAPLSVLGQRIEPIRLIHGPRFEVLGFRFGNVAYCTDVSMIPDQSWPKLKNLDVLILDALRHRPHITHFNIEQALEVVDRVRPRRTYFTHICHELSHAETNLQLPANVSLAYDGLRVPLS